jgi:hypothetical protein
MSVFFPLPEQPALFYQTDCSLPSRRPFAVTGAGDRAKGTGTSSRKRGNWFVVLSKNFACTLMMSKKF